MIERLFVGVERPLLLEAAKLLKDRYCRDGEWDMGSVVVALPGSQAARRLRRIIIDLAERGALSVTPPEMCTPAHLLEKLYTAPRPIAATLPAQFAWIKALERAGVEDRELLAPKADGAKGPIVWAGIAREAARVRDATMAECLSLADVYKKCGDSPDRRWGALARLESAYLAALAEAGLADRDEARAGALRDGAFSHRKDIVLISAVDLNGRERAMLRAPALTARVVAVIAAAEEERDRFDDTGTLLVEHWRNALVDIPDAAISFVEGPAEETHELAAQLAALGGAFTREEITVGVGDEAAAEGLARRLAVLGLPSFSPFGRLVSRVRPAALLGLVRDYLHSPTAANFAALARHPDLEAYFTHKRDSILKERAGSQPTRDAEKTERIAKVLALPLLTQIDIYRAECLPEVLPPGSGASKLSDIAWPSKAQIALEGVLAAHDAAAALLDTLRGGDGPRPIGQWVRPIADLLAEIYKDTPLRDDPEGRQFALGLAGLRDILLGLQDLPSPLSLPVSGAEALAFILGQAEAERLPSEPVSEGEGGLEMMGWLELALDDAPILLLTGLQEGCVPASTGDDSFLPDSLRRTLGLADDRRREARDRLLLRQMIASRQSDGRHVHLIVPRRGADGNPRMPSRLLFACGPEKAAVRAAGFADRPIDSRVSPSLFTPGEKRDLTPPLPVKHEPPLTEITISGFATYLACPYRFYLRHVHGLEEQDDSHDEINRRLLGVLIHECLAAFAKSDLSQSADAGAIQEYLRGQLVKQTEKRFGQSPSPVMRMQIRQAGRRLEAFSLRQSQSVLAGWMIQDDLSEKELTVSVDVDGLPFTIKGRLDRVDYHAASDRYRIIDYKTGDTAKRPEDKHCPRGPAEKWPELQLPLYRLLLAANGVDISKIAPSELGYSLLSADLAVAEINAHGRLTGGTGWTPAGWGEPEMDIALERAKEVIRKVRAGEFWPPADPPPFPPSRTDLGRVDPYSDLCLDVCSDRMDWFGTMEATS